MNIICRSVSGLKSKTIFDEIQNKYNISFPNEMLEFFKKNNGGSPYKKEFMVDDMEYEVRCFLSFNCEDYNAIQKPLDSFQKETKGKIVPVAKDSGDSYFCLNVENGKVYYWDKDENNYYKIADTFEAFINHLD